MEYIVHLLILISIYLVLAQGFNLVFGLGLLFNLSHISSYALGAYTTALLSVEYQVSWYQALGASALIAGTFALLIGAISLRLANDYFAIGTLAFSSVVGALLVNWKSVTRGVLGIPGIPRPVIAGFDLYDNSSFAVFSWGAALISLLIFYFIFRSSIARALRSQSQNEIAAQSLGQHTTRVRLFAFIISSLSAGLAGGIFAFYMGYIDPSSFLLNEMIVVLTICILGKPGSYFGTIASTFFLLLLPEALRFFELPSSILGPMRQCIYALILFVMVYHNRRTLFPHQRSI